MLALLSTPAGAIDFEEFSRDVPAELSDIERLSQLHLFEIGVQEEEEGPDTFTVAATSKLSAEVDLHDVLVAEEADVFTREAMPLYGNESEDLLNWVNNAEDGEFMQVTVLLPWTTDELPIPPYWRTVLAREKGETLPIVDARLEWLAERAHLAALAQERFWESVPGGMNLDLEFSRYSPVVDLRISAADWRSLRSAVQFVDAQFSDQGNEVLDDGSPTNSAAKINGIHVENFIQSTQFYDAGFAGDIMVASGEPNNSLPAYVHYLHMGFEPASGSGYRVENCTLDSPLFGNSTCSSPYRNPYSPSSFFAHHTGTVTVIAGDLTGGQHANVTNVDDRRERSGVAREASVVVLPKPYADQNDEILSLLAGGTRDIQLINTSYSTGRGCTAYGGTAEKADALYEAGLAVFKSAGNYNNDLDDDDEYEDYANFQKCNVGQPGQATGLFTVGAYYVSSGELPSSSSPTTKEGRMFLGSGWAGGTNQSDRTLVDIAAPSNHEYPYPHWRWPVYNGNTFYYGADWDDAVSTDAPGSFNATSGAAPVVAGAAAVYRDWSDSVGGIADDPGVLYARLLLMGDSWDGESSWKSYAYDRHSGAGRLRMRKFDSAGLDGPYYQSAGSVCVDSGVQSIVNIAGGGQMSTDVEIGKVVTWTHHNVSGGSRVFNDIDLRLQARTTTSGTWSSIATNVSGTDNKKRVVKENPTSGGA